VGDLGGAEEAFGRAIASGHAQFGPAAALQLGSLVEATGEGERARRLYEQAILSPDAQTAGAAAFLLARQVEAGAGSSRAGAGGSRAGPGRSGS